MPLTSIKKEVTEVVSDTLLDTGWTNVQGASVNKTLHTLTFDEDATIYFYRKHWKASSSGYFTDLAVKYIAHSNGTTLDSFINRYRDLEHPNSAGYYSSMPTGSQTYIGVSEYNAAPSTNYFRRERRGIELTAGQELQVLQYSTLTSSEGACYRLIAKKSTPERLDNGSY
jgi:hypothetical protein